MNNFEEALRRTLQWEGGFSDHPNDPGGPTYQGITRRDHPEWAGWVLVDTARAEDRLSLLASDPRMQVLVAKVYRAKYWDAIGLDRFEDAAIAAKVFDLAVNCGKAKAITILQRALNYVLPAAEEVLEDGKLGPYTITATNAVRPDLLLYALSGEQYVHYRSLVEAPSGTTRFEPFARGWIRRAFGGLCVERKG